ncbi:hypothetical protein ABB37_07811 [Leptomonas pyrrhocoris]|uniref:Calcium uniporter protein C-terminal domain-containing protein n=1 Tax=Leptomonas pyrrhocoris TaxID=157538 RepID=A0A0N0DSV8_LEPPY|nr:hypothetical protein ABB37_07811 [Leptomonas pyrrhocoris]XP_015654951.1 hypothetical protein ABB37_07811 [Leptomonas pyrrhocoris]KPA76511.1 hypothetical protein ABB37_07811 [Leptomonas pyrrhocoris]KPA76512.1 hypothetical protein ABB37_07811 [Leptomonas pyrrhocoris]|eukprot:XP_015654950.1 hypothetical protein ABB37_07811 [Leptomonas pyrrhocoris]
MFRPTGAKATPLSSVVLRTGYATSPATNHPPTDSAAAASTSYAVTDVHAFEQLLRDALQVTPVDAPQPDKLTSAAASTSSMQNMTTTATTLLANHTVRELQALLAETEAALEQPAARKAAIDRYAYQVYLPLLRYGTFALLSMQFVVYFNWIFFVFDWNLVEPTTYFLGYTGVFCSLVYHYYRCGEADFTWRNLFQHMARREAEKMYVAKKVDAETVALLQRRIAEVKAELARVSA